MAAYVLARIRRDVDAVMIKVAGVSTLDSSKQDHDVGLKGKLPLIAGAPARRQVVPALDG